MNEQMQLSNIRLFVSTKFSDLKYTIDIEYSKKITSTVDEKQRKSLIQIWAGLIDKIESIESKCVQNLRSIFKLFKKELPDQMGQFELESQLFMNTTILYISEEDLVQLNLIEKMSRLSGKLIIIKNCYFRPENLLKEPNEPISREYVICKQIEKIFENLTLINPIHEIELSIDCLTKLDLSNGNIKSIDSNTFKNLFNLTKIDLAHNQLTSLDSNLLTTQHNLIYIGLNNNKITKLNSDLFRNSTKLKYIYLNYNNLAELDAKQFSGLKELSHLYLNNNVLKCLHKNTLNSLSSLEFIELSNNLIGDLDEALFFGLTRLKTINLCNNLLTAIHSNLFNDLAELKSLFISSNQLTKFNANTFKGLENLDKLFLDDNLIESLDRNTFNELSNLTYLNLANNQLKRIEPGLFRNLAKLTLLYLNSNKLNSEINLTSEFISLTKLNQIRMDEKSICCDPRIFQMRVPIEYF